MRKVLLIKKIQYLSIALITICSLAACNKAKPIRDNKIKKICFATSAGGLHSPHVAIEIDSTLTYFFQESDWLNDTSKVMYSKVSQGFWDTLNMKVESIPENQLDSNYKGNCGDCLNFELLLVYGNAKKHIIYIPDNSVTKLDMFSYWLRESYKGIALKPCLEVTPRFDIQPTSITDKGQSKQPVLKDK